MFLQRFICCLFALLLTFSFSNVGARNMAITNAEICKAAISALFARPIPIMRVQKNGGIYFVSYTRDEDKTFWHYKCKVVDDDVLWGVPEGRWRTHPADERVKFKLEGDGISIFVIYPDGSIDTRFIPESQFR